VERINSEGIPRATLKFALSKTIIVMRARRTDLCMLCRHKGVNEAGLCEVCYASIQDPEEHRLIGKWLSGEGP